MLDLILLIVLSIDYQISTVHNTQFLYYRTKNHNGTFFPYMLCTYCDVNGRPEFTHFIALWIVEIDPLFFTCHNSMQKTLTFLSGKQNFTSGFSPFNVSFLQFIWKSFFFLFDLSWSMQAFENGGLSNI